MPGRLWLVRSFRVLLLAAGCAGPARSVAPVQLSPRPEPREWPAVDSVAEAQMVEQGLVGLAVGVVQDGRVVYARGYGLADREAGIPVSDRSTLFRWASVSKTLTGVVAARLATTGKLDLDAGVERYLSTFRPPTTYVQRCTEGTRQIDTRTYRCAEGFFELPLEPRARITARLLGGHLAGIMHYENGRRRAVPPVKLSANPTVNTGMEWALQYFATAPLVAVPGESYSYSTFGFNLLGVVLERAGGARFAELVAALIARPLGLQSLQPDLEWVAMPERAAGYWRDPFGRVLRQESSDVSWKLAGGGFVSTVRDLASYCAGLASERLLSSAEKALLWTPQRTTTGEATKYGLGFAVGGKEGARFVEHSGSQEKARTQMRLYPEEGFCLVVMSNSTYADTGRLTAALEPVARTPTP